MGGYTPGPWIAEPVPGDFRIDIVTKMEAKYWVADQSRLGEVLCLVIVDDTSHGEAAANAKLIAAAPDVMEALVMVRDADDDCRRDGLRTIPAPARAKIDAALEKAGF